jgi:sulfur-carrier protein
MPTVFIPTLLRRVAGGRSYIDIPGATVREVIGELCEQCPELRGWLTEGDRLHPSVTVAVNGMVQPDGLHHKVEPDAEIHFVVSIRGG